MKHARRTLLRVPAFGVLVLAATPLFRAPAHAATLKTHTSATYGYSISYPANWKNIKNADEDLNRESPDGNAFLAVAITGQVGTLSPSALKKLVISELVKLKASPNAISGSSTTIDGVKLYFEAAVVQGNGAKLTDVFLVTQRRGHLYIFNGGFALGTPQTKMEQDQVNAGLDSITFAK